MSGRMNGASEPRCGSAGAAARAAGRHGGFDRARWGGFTLIEVVCSLLVVGLCLTILVRLSHWHLQDSRRLHRRSMALEHATNLLEELRSRPWDELIEGNDREESLPEDLVSLLPNGRVRIRVTAHSEGIAESRRLAVQIEWNDFGDAPAQVELVAWRHPRRVASTPEGTP